MTELRNQINNIVQDHQECLVLAKSVGTTEVYEGTTATAEDIREGKTAYSNGEKLVGTFQAGNNNASVLTEIGGGNVSTKLPSFFKQITRLEGVKLKSLNSGQYAFSTCESLEYIEIDLNDSTSMMQCFNGCTNLKEVKIIDSNKNTAFNSCFQNCSSLEVAPELNTSLASNLSYMFTKCSSLKTVPVYNLAKATNIAYMFNACTSLTDESLNNILASCITATAYTGTKTLAEMRLSEEQATRCQSLSNYAAFTAAGWTTGY